jgi:hypothetical protein
MRKSGHEEWVKDLRERQRNIVFPDTLRNEARGWRRLMKSKQPLTVVQKVGIGLLCLGMGVVFLVPVSDKLRGSAGDPILDRLVGGFGDWIVLFAVLGTFFLLLRWRVRRALLTHRHRASGTHDLN